MGYISRGGGFKEDSTPVFVPKKYMKKLDRYLLRKGDLTIAMTDMKNSMALLRHTARIPEDERFVLNQRVGLIRVRKTETLDPLYLYYFSNSPDYIAYLRSRANSGVQVNLSTSAIKESVLKVPPLGVQKSISETFGRLDDKIQHNRETNQTLEQMAQAIFKSWFVDFEPVKAKIAALEAGGSEEDALLAAIQAISGKDAAALAELQAEHPDQYNELRTTAELFPSAMQDSELGEIPVGWSIRSLEELCTTITKGTTPKKAEIAAASDIATVPFVKVKDITDNGEIAHEGLESIPESINRKSLKRSILRTGDLLFSIAGTIGRVAIVDASLDSANTNQAVGIIRLREHKKYLLDKPNIGLLSEEFLEDVRQMPYKNLAVELLERLLKDDIRAKTRNNVVQEKKYGDRLQETLRKYNNRAIETAQVIEELIQMAKDFQAEMERDVALGLNADEIAFYDALANNESAVRDLGDEILKKIAVEVTESLRKSTTVDWQVRESVRARLSILIRRILQKYKYPPDKAPAAIDLVMEQAEALSNSWSI